MEPLDLYDYTIIGAGAAGLQLVYELIENKQHEEVKILLIDSGDRSNKSWCFWQKEKNTSFPFLIEKSWSEVRYISSKGRTQIEAISPLTYHYISSENFFSYFFNTFIPTNQEINHQLGWVTQLHERDDHVEITLQNGLVFRSKYVADSRIKPAENPGKQAFQHFYGKFIQFDHACLNDSHLTLMDFSLPVNTKEHAIFHYILPFNDQKALIETTSFTAQPYDKELFEQIWEKYMATNFPNISYQIISKEQGTIPMQLLPEQLNGSRVFTIGTAGGLVKASTGYAFTRMHEDAKNRSKNHISPTPRRFRFYDSLLLNIIHTELHQIPLVMDRLFSNVSFYQILKFLDEKSSITEEIRLFARLDIGLFLKHCFKRMPWR